MKRIHFENTKNWIWITVLILSLILIITGGFEVFEFENPKLNKRISAIGFLVQFVYYSKMFWYKNYVKWNKRSALIKINSLMGKTLNFNQIIKTELIEKKLIITEIHGNKVTFDLNDITVSDTQKLNAIIVKNTVASV